jgi:hypothetical protein
MTAEFPRHNLPDEYVAKIHEIAVRNGMSDEDVVAEMMQLLLDLAYNYPNEDESCIARRLRSALREKFGIGPE